MVNTVDHVIGCKGGLRLFSLTASVLWRLQWFFGCTILTRLAVGNHVASVYSMAELYPTIAQCAIAASALKILLIPA